MEYKEFQEITGCKAISVAAFDYVIHPAYMASHEYKQDWCKHWQEAVAVDALIMVGRLEQDVDFELRTNRHLRAQLEDTTNLFKREIEENRILRKRIDELMAEVKELKAAR